MAIREELTLGLSGWKTNLDAARNDVRRFHDENRRSAQSSRVSGGGGGVGGLMGGALAGVGTDVLGALGLAGGITGIAVAVKGALAQADDLADLSLALNESAEALQRVDFAGQQAASIGIDQVAKSMLRLERSLSDPENKNAAEALENLGLSGARLAEMSIDEKVVALADAFQKAREDGTGLKDIQDLLGRTAGDLVPLFEQGGDALRGMFERAPVMAEETVQQMARVNDQIDEMIAKGKTFATGIVGKTIEGGEMISDAVKSLMGGESFSNAVLGAVISDGNRDFEAKKDFEDRAAERKNAAEAQAKNAAETARVLSEKKTKDDAEAQAIKNEDDREKRVLADRERREKESSAFGDARFRTLTMEQQMADLLGQLEKSLGIGNADNRTEILQGADALAKSGKFSEASNVLKNLGEMEAIAGRMEGGAAATGAVGSFAGLMDQIFGRGTPEQQLDEMRKANTLAEGTSRTLDMIYVKMEQTPPVSIFGEE